MHRFPGAPPTRRRVWPLVGLLLVLPLAGSAAASGGRETEAAYHYGKAVMERRLACDDCALDHAPRSQEEARELARRLRDGELGAELTAEERWALRVYLEERWQL